MNEEMNLAKIRWRCHRGMLELDLYLLAFFDQTFPSLTDSEKKHFVALLEKNDPTLLAWILGHEVAEPAYAALIRKIRHFHAIHRT